VKNCVGDNICVPFICAKFVLIIFAIYIWPVTTEMRAEMRISLRVKRPLFLSELNQNKNMSTDISKKKS
jgi:hypothetical protein